MPGAGATVIGDTEIGENTNIWFGCTVRGDVHEIRIGARVNLQDGSVVHVTGGRFGTYIGDDVTIGHMALIHAATLQAGCFIGMKACVMDGAVVETGAMVAAGALVTPGKRVPAGELWGGSPAKKLRDLTDDERANLTATVGRYCALAGEYRDAGIGNMPASWPAPPARRGQKKEPAAVPGDRSHSPSVQPASGPVNPVTGLPVSRDRHTRAFT